MTKSPSIVIKTLLTLAVAGSMAAFFAQPAAAQTAKKLDCKGCLTSKQLKNGRVKGKDLKDSTVTGGKIAPNAVDGSKITDGSLTADDLLDEASGDFSEANDFKALTGGLTVVRSVDVTAPADGVVIVNSGGYCIFDFTPSSCVCGISTDTTVGSIFVFVTGENNDANRSGNIANTRGFSVSAGTTTFNLVCSETGQVRVADAVLTAIYVPTRN